jgi:protein Cut8
MRASVPFGNRMTSDYAFNRVRGPLIELLDALRDYTQNFLPPRETQTSVSLKFLDEVTNMLHRLPNWDSYQNQRHKHEAYEEISMAWALVIREAAKKAGGFQLRVGHWDEKLGKHNDASGGRLGEAMEALRESLSWMGGNQDESSAGHAGPSNLQSGMGGSSGGRNPGVPSIREQLFSGTYGMGSGGRMGGWE